MTTELAGITFSFEARFARQTPGFSHSPRHTYEQYVCTRLKRKIVCPALWSHTSHVHGPVHVAIGARVSATKVCLCLWLWNFAFNSSHLRELLRPGGVHPGELRNYTLKVKSRLKGKGYLQPL